MILDALLEFADGQSGTTNVASTNVVDTVAGGDAYAGGMAGLFFVIRIDTAFTATGAPTATFQLQTSDNEDFTGVPPTTITLIQSADYLASELPANTIIPLAIPSVAKRYIRGYNVSTGSASDTDFFTAGAWDMYVTKDAPITRELA